jgi:hypothetical protein
MSGFKTRLFAPVAITPTLVSSAALSVAVTR